MSDYPLEPPSDEMRALTQRVTDFAQAWVEGITQAPANISGSASRVTEQMRAAIPRDEPAGLDEALATIAAARDFAYNSAGPGFMAYIPGGGVYAAALGDYLTAVMNRYSGYSGPAPAFAELEWNLIRWMCSLFDYPEEAKGTLTSGGSVANFSAVLAARTSRLGDDFSQGTMYVSTQAHHSLHKAASMAGFPRDAVRSVPVGPGLRMDPDALSSMIENDMMAGLKPFMVAASAGTTNTGAVDPMPELRAICDRHGMWLHADGAYGGFFQLTARGKQALNGIESADSITLDPHKGLFLPYGTGALIVRDGTALRAAHGVGSIGYLSALPEGLLDFADYSPEMSRHMRTLRLWLPLTLHGVNAFRQTLDEKLDLAVHLHDQLSRRGDLDMPWGPGLSIVAFRLKSGEEGNDLNKKLLEKINASQRVLLSPTEIDGVTWLRAAILAHRTHRDRVDELVSIIDEAINDTRPSPSQ